MTLVHSLAGHGPGDGAGPFGLLTNLVCTTDDDGRFSLRRQFPPRRSLKAKRLAQLPCHFVARKKPPNQKRRTKSLGFSFSRFLLRRFLAGKKWNDGDPPGLLLSDGPRRKKKGQTPSACPRIGLERPDESQKEGNGF